MAGSVLGLPIFRAFTANGAPLVGGKLFSYAAGTSTPQATYTDASLSVPNANPVILDANGQAPVWLSALGYKLILQDSLGVVQWTLDNIVEGLTTVNSANVPYTYPGTGGILRTVQDVLSDTISVKQFGAKGDGITDDTAAIQFCLDNFNYVSIPAGNYNVTTLNATKGNQFVDMQGSILIGISTVPVDCILNFQAVSSTWVGLVITGSFSSMYKCCVRWYNATQSSQFNVFFGMSLYHAYGGLFFGPPLDQVSTLQAQSENTIYGFFTRGVQVNLEMNHGNGFLFLESPMLVAEALDWPAGGGFDHAKARCFIAQSGNLDILGGEMQNASGDAVLGRVFEVTGASVYLTGAVTETNVPISYTSGLLVMNGGRTFNTTSNTSQFLIADGAVGELTICGGHRFLRPTGTGTFSAMPFASALGVASSLVVTVDDSVRIIEWRQDMAAGNLGLFIPYDAFSNLRLSGTRFLVTSGSPEMVANNTGVNILAARQVDTTCITLQGWFQTIAFGGGTTYFTAGDGPPGYANTCIENAATGEAYVTNINSASTTTVRQTGIPCEPGDMFSFDIWIKINTGTSAGAGVLGYDQTGTLVGFTKYITESGKPTPTGWHRYFLSFTVPAGVNYIGIGSYGNIAHVRMSNVRVFQN